jgi:tetratricopeptide (TPR) repeat protein
MATSRGDFDEVEVWLQRIQDAVDTYSWPEVSLVVTCKRGELARVRGDLVGAKSLLEQVIEWAEQMEDRAVLALANCELGCTLCDLGDLDNSDDITGRSLAVYDDIGDRPGAARCWQVLGQIAMQRGDYKQAMLLMEQGLLIFEDCGDRWGMASTVNSMGDVARNDDDLAGAEKLYRRARGLLRAMGSQMWIFPDTNIGLIHLARREHPEARIILERAIAAFTKTGHNAVIIGCHLGLAACAASKSQWLLWDEHMGEATQMIEASEHADEDSARCATYAGDSALSQGDSDRARGAYEVSLRIYAILGRTAEVAVITDKLASI